MDCAKRNDENVVEQAGDRSEKYKKVIISSADELVCPFTLELPLEPVIAEDGKVYERTAIEEHVAKNGFTLKSPVTNKPMGNRLFPALQVRNVIEQLVGSGVIDGDKAATWNKELEKRKEVAALRKKSEDGDAEAMYNLAFRYADGNGVKKDISVAYTWFNKASDGGNVAATAMLGCCLLDGIGTASNNALGLVLLGTAEEAGSDVAAYTLAKVFCKGTYGLPKDPVQVKKLLRKVVHRTCEVKHIHKKNLKDATNILKKLDGPAIIAPEHS